MDNREIFIQTLGKALKHSFPNEDAVGIARDSLAFSIELQKYVSKSKKRIERELRKQIDELKKENKKLRYKSLHSYKRASKRLEMRANAITEDLRSRKLIRITNKKIEAELKDCSFSCLLEEFGDVE